MFVVHDTPCLFSSMMSIKSAYGSTLPFKTSLATIHKLAKKAILEFSIFWLLKIVNSLILKSSEPFSLPSLNIKKRG